MSTFRGQNVHTVMQSSRWVSSCVISYLQINHGRHLRALILRVKKRVCLHECMCTHAESDCEGCLCLN